MLNYFCVILCKPYAVRDSAHEKSLRYLICLWAKGLIHLVLFEGIRKRRVVKPSLVVFVSSKTQRDVATGQRGYQINGGARKRSMDKGCRRKDTAMGTHSPREKPKKLQGNSLFAPPPPCKKDVSVFRARA